MHGPNFQATLIDTRHYGRLTIYLIATSNIHRIRHTRHWWWPLVPDTLILPQNEWLFGSLMEPYTYGWCYHCSIYNKHLRDVVIHSFFFFSLCHKYWQHFILCCVLSSYMVCVYFCIFKFIGPFWNLIFNGLFLRLQLP